MSPHRWYRITSYNVCYTKLLRDGRVSESEIELARNIMQRMNLNDEMRQAAIRLFNQGKQPDFVLTDVLRQFRRECHGRRNLMRMFAERNNFV